MDVQRNSLLDSGAVLAATTGFLYCVSAAYYYGFLRVFQLDANVLDRDFKQSLYYGFTIAWVPTFVGLLCYVIARYLYSHVLFPSINDWLKNSHRNKRRFLKFKHQRMGKRKDSKLELLQKKHTLKIALYLGTFMALILSLVHFETKGKEEAASSLNKINNKSILPSDLITVKIDDNPHQLFFLVCGARNCAGIDPDTKIIYYFPQNGHSYQLPEPQKTQTQSSVKKAS